MSETKLITLKDILGSMLAIKSRGPAIISTRAPPQFKNFSALINDSQWEAGRLGYTAELIVKILKEDRAHAGNDLKSRKVSIVWSCGSSWELHVVIHGLVDGDTVAMKDWVITNKR